MVAVAARNAAATTNDPHPHRRNHAAMNTDKIRIAVAEKMGWTFIPDFIGSTQSGIGTARGEAWLKPVQKREELQWWEEAKAFEQEPPNYPASLDACRPVIERLKEEGWWFELMNGEPQPWVSTFCRGEENAVPFQECASDPALAICLAALRVWGIDPEALK